MKAFDNGGFGFFYGCKNKGLFRSFQEFGSLFYILDLAKRWI